MKNLITGLVFTLCLFGFVACSGSSSNGEPVLELPADADPSINDNTDNGTDNGTAIDPSPSAEICDDISDNDGDDALDCDDTDCAADAFCQAAAVTEICDDAIDNDGNGALDCDDTACGAELPCIEPDRLRPDLKDIDTADANFLWVSPAGDDAAACSFDAPCKTLQAAVDRLTSADQSILALEGRYARGFKTGAFPVKIYGGVYSEAAEDGSVTWKAGSKDHQSVLRLTGERDRVRFDATETEGGNLIKGFEIRSGAFDRGLVVKNASLAIKDVILVSAAGTVDSDNDTGRSDNGTPGLVDANFTEPGDYRLVISHSKLRVGKLTGTEGSVTKIHSQGVQVNLAHADAKVHFIFERSRLAIGNIEENPSATSWTRGIYVHDSAGAAVPSRIEIADSTFVAGHTDITTSIELGGAFKSSIKRNRFRHEGSGLDHAVYAGNGPATASVGELKIANNLILMGNASGGGIMSHAIYLEKGVAMNAVNNTIVHDGVGNGYGVTVKSGLANGVKLTNNVFSNNDENDSVHVRLEESLDGPPSSSLMLRNNLFHDSDEGTGVLLEVTGGAYLQYTAEADVVTAYGGVIAFENNLYGIDPNFTEAYATQSEALTDAGKQPDPLGERAPARVDLLGNPRIVDGDGDGNAVIDLGAIESQPAE